MSDQRLYYDPALTQGGRQWTVCEAALARVLTDVMRRAGVGTARVNSDGVPVTAGLLISDSIPYSSMLISRVMADVADRSDARFTDAVFEIYRALVRVFRAAGVAPDDYVSQAGNFQHIKLLAPGEADVREIYLQYFGNADLFDEA